MYGVRADNLRKLIRSGTQNTYLAGQMVHALDFADEIYWIEHGYVKRYSVSDGDKRSLQAVYGPDFFFPLSPVYDKLLHLSLGEEHATYLYEALSDVEVYSISIATLEQALADNQSLYRDLFYEAGRRLRSNIHNLENHSIRSCYQKIAHHLAFAAEEFGAKRRTGVKVSCTIPFTLSIADLAALINAELPEVTSAVEQLTKEGLVHFGTDGIDIADFNLLQAAYL